MPYEYVAFIAQIIFTFILLPTSSIMLTFVTSSYASSVKIYLAIKCVKTQIFGKKYVLRKTSRSTETKLESVHTGQFVCVRTVTETIAKGAYL